MPSLPLDPDTERFLQDSLEPGETIRWSGRPATGRMVRRALPAIALAILALTAVSLATSALSFWHAGALTGRDVSHLIFAGVFILMLLWLPFWTVRSAPRTGYAVTDRRAILVQPGVFSGLRLRSFFAPFPRAEGATPGPDGGGDLVLGTITVQGKYGSRQQAAGFFGLTDLEEAKRAVQALHETASRNPGEAPAPSNLQSARPRSLQILFSVIGAGVIAYGGYLAWLAYQSASWPTTTATILSSQVRVVHGRHTSYSPDVRYEYDVQDRTYQGRRISYGGSGGSYAAAAAVAHRYPFNALVPVSYDPAHPARGVLEPGLTAGVWFLPGFGVFFLGVGWLASFRVGARRSAA